MDEHDVRWDALLISNLSKRPLAEVTAYVSQYTVMTHRLQILYHFDTDKYWTWLRLVDHLPDEGELFGNGDLKSATVEFKRLFERQTLLPWEKRDQIPHGLPDHLIDPARCVCIQPPSEDEKQIIISGTEQSEAPIKVPEGVPGLLKLLFGNGIKMATYYLFNEVANNRIKSSITVQLHEDILTTAIAVLDKLDFTLTEYARRKVTRNSPTQEFRDRQTRYLKECYFGLMRIVNRSSSEPLATDHDWLKQERENILLLLKLRMATNRAHLFYNGLSTQLAQQALASLGLAEIKKGT
jgi:hypothetical protein